jgi:hypothetical protein
LSDELAELVASYYHRPMDHNLTEYNVVDSTRKWHCNLCVGYLETIC